MAQNVYEGMFIFDSAAYGRKSDEVSSSVNQMIEAVGGEILVSRLWMDGRRLAYPINGQRKGTYWLTYFSIDGAKLSGLERQSQLNDAVLRHLFIKIDPRIVDALVQHAQAGPSSDSDETPPSGAVSAAVTGKAVADKAVADKAVAEEAVAEEAVAEEVAPVETEVAVDETPVETTEASDETEAPAELEASAEPEAADEESSEE